MDDLHAIRCCDSHRCRPVSRRLPSRGIYPTSRFLPATPDESRSRNRGGTRSRGVICPASTNRPDCQRSRCRHKSTDLKSSRGASAWHLLRHPEYYRNTWGRSRTFWKTRLTFWEPPLPISKTRPASPQPQTTPFSIPSNQAQVTDTQPQNAGLRNGIHLPATPQPPAHTPTPAQPPGSRFVIPPQLLAGQSPKPVLRNGIGLTLAPHAPRQNRPGISFRNSGANPCGSILSSQITKRISGPPAALVERRRHQPPGPYRPPSPTRQPHSNNRQTHENQSVTRISDHPPPLPDRVTRCAGSVVNVL